MYERGIGVEDVRHVLATGRIIEEYPNTSPILLDGSQGLVRRRT